ncbi:MAG: ATP-binding protein [Peptococcaceae bacterium]|jgi:MinD superfamily P-loop ATPase|nr:ATP-binding protein [Peptococcaceae bacterium]MDH7524008.1 ATP-binding protein [Peptococcaceae bacterium]
MNIAIASGKGGTGKTTVATNLAFYLQHHAKEDVALLDCDVEEPNCHLFLKSVCLETKKVILPVPSLDPDKCTGCGKCSEICQFAAIACIKGKVLTFPELCHGCGGCILACPAGALSEQEREIGTVETGTSGKIKTVYGQLRVGEAMSPPLIRAVKSHAQNGQINIIDSPPGTSCPVIQAVKGCDFVLLVTEPTPFGLNDLSLAVEMVRVLGLPFAVGINRSTIGDEKVREYCRNEKIPIILEIPEDREIASMYSRGRLVLESLPHYMEKFEKLYLQLKEVIPC